jgi:hypothetical protein
MLKNDSEFFMPKSLLSIALLLLAFSGFSQNILLRGKVVDKVSQLPLESATVYLTRVSDSTVIDYTITDKSGAFQINTRKIDKPVMLKVSYVSYQTLIQEQKSLIENIDFGVLRLAENNNTLKEVVIKSEAPPIRIKNDTLEFNASSFKVRPDANVEALLKQLPGVEIDEEGKIKVNGKEVNQILVNGKPFFDKDGKVALQNLPSDIINKVQVTDSKTKAEEISGKTASSDNASINLTIDEDKNKGLFGKFTGGYGTDERFESSLLLNYFKDTRKISILASANNINSTGFSMNEIFDNMGGGRNYSVWSDDNGGFAINGMRFGGGKGITRSNIAGANYADVFFKDFDTNGSYFYTGANTKNTNRTKQLNFLPEGNYTTESNANTEDDKYAHNFNIQLEYKIDSTATLSFNPKFVKSHSSYKNRFDQVSIDENEQLLNDSNGDNISDADKFNFENSMYFYKGFKRKGRSISLNLENNNDKNDSFDLTRSFTNFYTDTDNNGIPDTTTNDDRNQIKQQREINDHYFGEFEYIEPITDSLMIMLRTRFSSDVNIDDKETFDFDSDTQRYSAQNDLLTSYMESDRQTFGPGVGIQYNKKKFMIGINTYTEITSFRNKSLYLGETITLNKDYMLPAVNAYFNYRFTKSKSMWVSYNLNTDFPDAYQVLPVVNLSNPLNTFIGNSNLDPNKRHSVYLSFRNYDYTTKSGYTLYSGGNYFTSQGVASSFYDESRKRTTTYQNVFDTYNLWYGGNWSKSIKREANTYRISLSLNGNYDRNKGYIDAELYDSKSLNLTPKVNFTYEYGELLTINPSYKFTYSGTKYSNYVIDKTSNVFHQAGLQTTSYWPKHVVLGNDLSYNYNSNISDGFKKDFYLWNVSLGYNFFGDKLLAKVKVFDLLNQNQSATRTISATSVRDEENIVLRRYAMFSLTYKLEKFGGKKKEERNWFHMD